jgi:hypothetical protein
MSLIDDLHGGYMRRRFLALMTTIVTAAVAVVLANPAPAAAVSGATYPPLADRSYLIYNVRGLKCLDVDGGGTANGTWVQQWTCDLAWNKQWLITKASVNNVWAWRIKPRHASDKCLSVKDDLHYVIRTCDTGWDQFFLFYDGPDGGYAKFVMPYYRSRAWQASESNWRYLTIPPGDDVYWKNQTHAENMSRVPWDGSQGS